jgi:hypothetical protein
MERHLLHAQQQRGELKIKRKMFNEMAEIMLPDTSK